MTPRSNTVKSLDYSGMLVGMANPSPDCALPGSCAPARGEERVPLVALLGRLEAAFVAEFDARLATSPFCALSLAHSRNVLRHLGAGPRRASQIVAMTDVSKQAISQQIAHLERNGYLRTEPDPDDQRARILVLTAKGERAQAHVKATFVEIEQDWGALLPAGDDLTQLRSQLTDLVAALQGAGPGRPAPPHTEPC